MFSYNNKYVAVSVPTEEESRAVQEAVIKLGGRWHSGRREYLGFPNKDYARMACIRTAFPAYTMSYGDFDYYRNNDYLIISSHLFLFILQQKYKIELRQLGHYSKQ